MVYQALLTSAKKIADSSDSDYSSRYFGNGVLQAKDALNKKPKDFSHPQKKRRLGVDAPDFGRGGKHKCARGF
jgi:hypothetical protein